MMGTSTPLFPEVGELWVKKDGKGGLNEPFETARVMGVVEDYIVARFRGCAPFLRHHADWWREFKPQE